MEHAVFIQRCLQLAELGRGYVAPNPMVGCVIVHNNKIIAEGYHHAYGSAHAEVNALDQIKDKSVLTEATVYVSLEPCAHTGKTPPCAVRLVDEGVKKVVIGCADPNPHVAGKGIQILESAGIEVITGILEKECRDLNKRFITFHEQQRPFIILKWAETRDGFMAGRQQQISGQIAQTYLHRWRSEEMAFMVGTNTLMQDNPSLSVRHWKGKNPIRVAVDWDLKSEGNGLNFYDQSQETIILNGIKDDVVGRVEYIKLENKSCKSIIHALYKKNIQSVVIEGGAHFLQSFIYDHLFDEIRLFTSKELLFGEGLKSPDFSADKIGSVTLDTDVLNIFAPHQ
ncbi:MAG: bifunctional diaminohydroxyphosphoribosylaminopyrimidine deaminase/5-amino-6-(5-phosphoribosylamino)uracil reductase RibD [Bacteroidota bacterium]